MNDSVKGYNNEIDFCKVENVNLNSWLDNYKFTSNILPEKIPTGYVNILSEDKFKIKKNNTKSKELPEITTPYKNNKQLFKTKDSIPKTRFVDVQKEVKPYIN